MPVLPPLVPVEALGVALEVLLWPKVGGAGATVGVFDGVGVAVGVSLGVALGVELGGAVGSVVADGFVAERLPPCELEPRFDTEKLASLTPESSPAENVLFCDAPLPAPLPAPSPVAALAESPEPFCRPVRLD